MQNESILNATESITDDGPIAQGIITESPVAGVPGGAGHPATGVLHLLLTTAPANEKVPSKSEDKLLGVRSAIARKADTLRQNLQDMIDRNGIDRMGFMTLTFKWNIRSQKTAEKRFHSFATHILPDLVEEYIAVPERQQRGAIHYHLAVAFPFDIRSGFNLAVCSEANLVKRHGYLGGGKWAAGYKEHFYVAERLYLASANANLKHVWRVIRESNKRIKKLTLKSGRKFNPAFGRCETLPILSNADAIAFYVGTYITSQTLNRAPEDKGWRSVRYSMKQRRFHQTFQFKDGGNAKWRAGCRILGQLLLIHDQCTWTRAGKEYVFHYPKNHVRSRFGSRWPHKLAPWVFACYENETACKEFAQILPPEMPWHERRVAVERFLRQFKGHLRTDRPKASGGKVYDTSVSVPDAEPTLADASKKRVTTTLSPNRWRTWIEKSAGEEN